MSSSNDGGVFSTVHAAVAAVAESTTDDSDNYGGVKGPVVPEVKGNDDVAVSKVDEKKKSSLDDMSGNDPAGEVIVGGGEVAGQERRGDNDDVVVAGAVDSTTVHDAHSGGVGGPVIGPETRGNVDFAESTVDVESTPVDEDHPRGGGGAVVGAETEGKDEHSVDHVSELEADSIAIDLMVNKMRRSLMSRDYKRWWNQPHRSRVFASVNPDTPSDVSVNVDKAEHLSQRHA
jgi:hypothetical protein